ncbi:mechanosensitive ion channel family protein [Methanolobus profundi]|uniref:Small-conductance mechanosensitive channel n=1 Tax=Methanolobus profundi TaxID=487685 RepID=A0A1I4QUP7_9EURY|nr:mechanosensitive ion channel domain-containing protein [Methanolobus profundi]SFM43802.1 Small-conductance mechanosensitive channel [Methanolobus profundi]
MGKKTPRSGLIYVRSKLMHKSLNSFFMFFAVMILIALGIIAADKRHLISVPEAVTGTLEALVVIFVSYAVATLFTKLTVNRFLNYFEEMGEIEERILMGKMYLWFVYLLATLAVFWYIGITVNNIAIFLGLITTGFAFAIRDIILSYFIWFILLTKKPFKIGDYIRVGEDDYLEGQVKHIGLFYVVVTPTPDTYDDFFKIPNKVFLEQPIKNHGRGKFRNEFDMYFEMDDLPEDLPAKVEALKEMVWNTLDVSVSFFLGSDRDGVKITVYYKSTYDRREQVRHQITSMMLNELRPVGK